MKGSTLALVLGGVAVAGIAYYFLVWKKRHGHKLAPGLKGKTAPKKGKGGWRHRFASLGASVAGSALNTYTGGLGTSIAGKIGVSPDQLSHAITG